MSKKINFVIGCVVIVLSNVCHASLITFARTSISTNLSADDGVSGPYENYVDSVWGSLIGSYSKAESSLINMNSTIFASSEVLAGYGVLKGSVAGARAASYSAYSYVSGEFSDRVKLVNDALIGQTGTVTAAFYYDYDFLSSADYLKNQTSGGVSFVGKLGAEYGDISHTWLDVGDVSLNNEQFLIRDAYGERSSDDMFSGLIYITTSFVWGSWFDTSFQMVLQGNSSGPGSYADYFVDAMHSGYWAGIQSVTVDGQKISDFTVLSESGTDYSRSFVPTIGDPVGIPEPASYIMVLFGLAGLGVSTRRSKLA